MRGLDDQKRHRDVFCLQQPTVLILLVARAAIKHKNGPLVEGSKQLSQRFPLLLDVGDEDVFEPVPKNVTCDKTVLCRVEGDVFWVVPVFEKQGVDGRVLDYNRRLEAGTVKRNARHQRAPLRRARNTNRHSLAVCDAAWNEDVDVLAVRVPLGTHLVHVEDEGGVDALESGWQRSSEEPS